MAGRTTTRHGATAKARTKASSPKPSTRRASTRATATPSARVGAPKAAAGRKPATTRKPPGARKPAAKTPAARRTPAAPLRIGGVPVLPVSIVLALVLLGWFMYPMARLHYQEQRKVERLQAQLTQIQQRNQRLKKDVLRLQTAEGIEEAARELGMARKGEQLWVTMPEGGGPASETTAAAPLRTADVTPALWTQVLDAVFGVGP